MSPLGKLTLGLLGCRFWGVEGLLCGLFLGHLLVDKTYVIRRIEQETGRLDDYIRIKLPYKYYRYYNRLDGNIWGKLWGSVLGTLLFGFWGFVFLFVIGQFVFDMPQNAEIRKIKKKTDHFFDNNWGKFLGATFGFVLNSLILIFVGLVLGFVFDYQRLEGAKLIPFGAWSKYWQKINPLKLWRHAVFGEHKSYLETMAALAALIAEADGKISDKERKVFCQIFAVKSGQKSVAASVLETGKYRRTSFEKYSGLLEKLTRNNESLQEVSIENLFKVAAADGKIDAKALKLLEKTAESINLDKAFFLQLQKKFTPNPVNKKLYRYYDVLGVPYDADLAEIKAKWKKLIVIYHPDKLANASAKEIRIATERMAEINLAYQEIVKARSKK